MTPYQEVARKKKLVSAAKALLSLQVGIAIGCVRIMKLLSWLSMWDDPRFQVFGEFIRATKALPLGNERLLWATAALLESDAKLAELEIEFRPELLKACVAIIEAYGEEHL
jgi:hypothetical protein